MRQGPGQQWGGIRAEHGWHCPTTSRGHLVLALWKERTLCPTTPNSKCKKSMLGFRTSTLAIVRKDMACSCPRKMRAWPSCKTKRRKRKECKESSQSTTCKSIRAPATQAPHTVSNWGTWKCKNVALWDTATRGCVGWTPPETWGSSSRCGSTKGGLQRSCLSRSLRRSGPSPTTQDVTMECLFGTQTKEISYQEQQQWNAIPGHSRAKDQSHALVYSNRAGKYGRIHKAQGQRG